MFKGDRIIVPHSLGPEILYRIHEFHFGIDKCRAQARGAHCTSHGSVSMVQLTRYLSAVLVRNICEATKESLLFDTTASPKETLHYGCSGHFLLQRERFSVSRRLQFKVPLSSSPYQQE